MKFIKYIFTLCTLVFILSGCGGGGNCKGCTSANNIPGTPSISLLAPNTYPAGIALTVYLTITNTSGVNATNLSYVVPHPNELGNTIGVDVDATNGDVVCSNLATGASCIFAALIPAGSTPGSFTVTASGTASGSMLHNTLVKVKLAIGLQDAFTTTAQVNIGLVDIPQNSHSLFVFPVTQTLNVSHNATKTVMFAVLVESGTPKSIDLQDGNGTNIATSTLFSPAPSGGAYAVNDVVTFSITYPIGQSTNELVQAVSNICSINCSNQAQVLFVESGSGILSLDPTYVVMSESYVAQTYTIKNIGESTITNITLPRFPNVFAVVNNCPTILAVGASCNFRVTYTPGYTSGIAGLNISYLNGLSTSPQTTEFSIKFVALPAAASVIIESAILTPAASIGNGAPKNSFYVESHSPSIQQLTLTYTNQGSLNANNFRVESSLLSAGYSISSNNCSNIQLESFNANNCTVIFNVDTATARIQNLSLHNSSIYASWKSMNNGIESSYESQSISWHNAANINESQESVYLVVYPVPIVTTCLSSESNICNQIESVMIESNFYLRYVLSGGYPGQNLVYKPTLPDGMESSASSCSLTNLAGMLECVITVDAGTNPQIGNVDFGDPYDGVSPQPGGAVITVLSPGVLSISAFVEPTIYTGEATTAVVTLSGSTTINTPVLVNITNNNPSIVGITPATCLLSSLNNSCTVTLSGMESGTATFSASVSGYQTQTSAQLIVLEQIFAYFTNAGHSGVNINSYTQCKINSLGIIESATCFAITPDGGGALHIPIGIVVDNARSFTYIVNSNPPYSYTQCHVISGFGIESSSCQTIAPSGAGTLDGPTYIALDTVNNFVYIPNGNGAFVTQCSVGVNGIESNNCTQPITASSGLLNVPQGVAVDEVNHWVYIVDPGSNYLQCPINASGIDSANCATVGSAAFGAVGIAVDSVNRFVYIGNGDATYTQCSITSAGINVASCTTGTLPIAFGPASAGVAVNNGIVTFTNNGTPAYAGYIQCTAGVSGINSASCVFTQPTGAGALNVPYGIAFGK